jgi:BirA family biotin operon repressor/biotin-[acetyl-CoA-carboxylase] ligase
MIIGKNIIRFKQIASTQDEARSKASQIEEGTVFFSETQSRGRGKPGAEWCSLKGGLYFSVVLKPYKASKDLAGITQIFAKAVVDSLSKLFNIKAEIKLPNDVLINGRKVCGILTERLSGGEDVPAVIVGIGINVNQESFPADLNATSLRIEKKKAIDLEGYFKVLLEHLDDEYLKFLKSGV